MAQPLARVFGLVAVMHKRNGGEFDGPDYATREVIDKMTAEAREENG